MMTFGAFARLQFLSQFIPLNRAHAFLLGSLQEALQTETPRRERTFDLFLAFVANAVIAGEGTNNRVVFLAEHTFVEL